MRVRSRVAAALLVLALRPSPGLPSDSRAGGEDMANWKGSAAWRRYKAAFDKVQGVESLRSLEKLEDEVSAFEDQLRGTFRGDQDLAQSLVAALHDRLRDRRRMLQVPRGRLPRPDWKADLTEALARLDHGAAALRGLRLLEARDPWTDRKLAPAVRHAFAVLEASLESLEKQLPGDPEAGALAARARAALGSARTLLDPPDPGR